MISVTIDRFEGEFAVVELEDGTLSNMPRVLLPEAAKEGDIISIKIVEAKKDDRQSKIGKLIAELWKD